MVSRTDESKTESMLDQKTHQAEQNHSSRKNQLSSLKQAVKPFQLFVTKFNSDWSLNLSAALAYHLMLVTVPIVVALLAVLGVLLGMFGQNFSGNVMQAITTALPAQVHSTQIVQGIKGNLQQSSGILGIIAVVSALFFGSRLFVLLETFFSIIYRVRPRSLLRQNVMALCMMLLFIILVPIMVLAGSVPPLAFSLLRTTPIGTMPVVANITGFFGGILASFLLFEAIYVVVPNLHVRLRHGWLGALVAAVALQFYLVLFPLYAAHFLKGTAGAAGFTVILLIFFYYFGVILFLGAEVNAFVTEGVRPMPNDLATFVSTMAGKLNEDIPTDERKDHVDTKPTDQAAKEQAIGFVKQTPEHDVPQRVSEDPEVQDEVLRQRGRDAETIERSMSEQQTAAVQTKQVDLQNYRSHPNASAPTSEQEISPKGIVLGVIVGVVLSFLVEVLRLHHK